MRESKSQRIERRRRQAEVDYDAAKHYAYVPYGMVLLKCSANHYQLRAYHVDQKIRWILNLYPINQRLYWDSNFHVAYYITNKLSSPWTLLSVVETAVRQLCKETKRDTNNESK